MREIKQLFYQKKKHCVWGNIGSKSLWRSLWVPFCLCWVCVYVCECVRERERERESWSGEYWSVTGPREESLFQKKEKPTIFFQKITKQSFVWHGEFFCTLQTFLLVGWNSTVGFFWMRPSCNDFCYVVGWRSLRDGLLENDGNLF